MLKQKIDDRGSFQSICLLSLTDQISTDEVHRPRQHRCFLKAYPLEKNKKGIEKNANIILVLRGFSWIIQLCAWIPYGGLTGKVRPLVVLSMRTSPWPSALKRGVVRWPPWKPPQKAPMWNRLWLQNNHNCWVWWVKCASLAPHGTPSSKYTTMITLMITSSTFVVSHLFLPQIMEA